MAECCQEGLVKHRMAPSEKRQEEANEVLGRLPILRCLRRKKSMVLTLC